LFSNLEILHVLIASGFFQWRIRCFTSTSRGLPNITIYIPQVHLVDGAVLSAGLVTRYNHSSHTSSFWRNNLCAMGLPEWVWNVPSSDPIRPAPKPKVTQTIHEVVELSISQNVTMERDAFWQVLVSGTGC